MAMTAMMSAVAWRDFALRLAFDNLSLGKGKGLGVTQGMEMLAAASNIGGCSGACVPSEEKVGC